MEEWEQEASRMNLWESNSSSGGAMRKVADAGRKGWTTWGLMFPAVEGRQDLGSSDR